MSMDIKQCLSSGDFNMQDEMILQINKDMIDDFCTHSTELERFHALFNMQKEYVNLQSRQKRIAAAHISYLISYYLSKSMSPPRAEDLKRYYANTAAELNPCQLYLDWLDEVDG